MKIWTLVWLLVFPPSDDGQTHWESYREADLTQEQCFHKLVERNNSFEHRQANGELAGFEIYCKEHT